MKRIISLMLVICIAAVTICGCSDKGKGKNGKSGTFTLMVYMIGSDLESKSMAASNDIVEMLESGLDTKDVNLVLLTGGAPMWHYDIPADVNATFIMGADDDAEMQMLPVSQTETLKNMGDPETLSGFLNDAVKAYPADHYGLICWDHGNGPLMGFGNDLNFDKDKIDLDELGEAFENSPFNTENKLEFIGFDACLMSSVEVANTLKDYAKYMIASQEKEPGNGWDYSFLSVLNDTYDVTEIADSILTGYDEYYAAKVSPTFNPEITLSCMDLSKTAAVNTALNDLFGAMEASLDRGDYYSRALERSRIKTFGDASYNNRGMSLDLADVGSLAKECASFFKEESDALDAALSDFIVQNQTNITGATGVSMYYPYYGTKIFENLGNEQYKRISELSQYQAYMDSFIQSWSKDWKESGSKGKIGNSINSELSDEGITFKLTEEQKSSFSKAYLNIFTKQKDDGDYYQLLLLGSLRTPDDDGNIRIKANEKIPVVNGRKRFPLIQRSSKEGASGYQTIGVGAAYRMYDPENLPVTIECTVEDGNDTIIINTINLQDSAENDEREDMDRYTQGKSSIESDRWECLFVPNLNMKPIRDGEGNLLPVSEWDWMIGNAYNIVLDEDNEFAMLPINDIYGSSADDYYYQIVVEDISGNQSWSELERFKAIGNPSEQIRKTSLGQYTYQIENDYARLTKYEGKDKELIVPEKIEGVPVRYISSDAFSEAPNVDSITIENPEIILQSANLGMFRKVILPEGLKEIPPRAFSGASKLEEIDIPDSVSSIGNGAFGSVHLKKLELPAGLDKIGYGAFKGTVIDEGVTFKGENRSFEIKDDYLLTKDGKILLAVFPSSETDIVIPDGVEEIAPHAHVGGEYAGMDYTLRHITFPESLKRIRYCAFECDRFEELIFPDGLEEIGHYAFYNPESFKETHTVNTVQFGSKLSWLGYCMLGDGRYRTLKISEKNRFYSVLNNRLMNKHGDAGLTDEAALSQTDNIADNLLEYEAYLAATDGLDLALYNFSAEEQDIKEYDGNTYSLKLIIKDKQKSSFPGADITLGGQPLTLPFSYNELMQAGLKLKDEQDAEKKIDAIKTITLLDDKDNSISARLRGDALSEVPIEDCKVDELDLNPWSIDDEPMTIDYNYRGVTAQSEIKDVFDALGAPSEITLSKVGDYYIMIYYTYCSYENVRKFSYRAADGTPYVPTSSFKVSYRYYPDTKTISMKEASLYLDTD